MTDLPRTGLAAATLWSSVDKDVRLYHRLRRPDSRESALSRLTVVLTSRGLWQLVVHRAHLALHAKRRRVGARHPLWLTLAYLFTLPELLIKVIAKCELLPVTELDGGIYVSDRGYIMLGARHVGSGSIIHHNVTIGVDLVTGGLPDIQDNVWIGPGSIIYGGITIGAGSTILPGSVLTKSVPARVVVEGNPGRVIRRGFDNSALLKALRVDAASAMFGSRD